MPVNASALAAVAAGSVFTYAGIKGYSVPQAMQYLVQGKSPATLPQVTGIDVPVALPSGGSANIGGGSATGQAIANDALRYKGQGYVYGGNASRPGRWDCSSYVTWVLGHDLGMSLPGGKWGDPGFPPNAHGPTTQQYATFGQAVPRDQVQAGDLVVWATSHMGIALNATSMISARSPSLGVGISTIADSARYHHGEPVIRRVGSS